MPDPALTRRARPSPRGDFASAAMVRVLVRGMADLGLPPAVWPAAAPDGAHVAIDTKRLLLRHAADHGGLACLPLLGRGIRRFAQEPVHRALASAHDAQDLFRRWSRLEAYVHSRHRVRVLELQPGEARLRHASLAPGAQPLPAESLVVLGLVAALLEEIGLEQVSCTAGGAVVFPQPHAAALAEVVRQAAANDWQIRWSPRPMAAAASAARTAPAPGGMPDLVATEPWTAVGKAAFRALAAGLPAPPGVAELARQLGLSPRGLQRQLQQAGLRYAGLLAEVRYRVAGWWLLHTALPLAEVGFLSGHADQPHLTRCFRQHSGMTPQAYRAAFGIAP
ncbi:helix-turn-helix transcriptional regulator [Comamonadaceae bacterium G21597-S1]|nr:helix-turn-helix transcriptional regulator [Comamonadaceae bacterium G21597-S1]